MNPSRWVKTKQDRASIDLMKKWRAASGLTQAQMARHFFTNRGKIAHWEQGRLRIPRSMVVYMNRYWPKEKS
jgi:DNA-binding transcriptional regulator YiaG